MYLAGGQHDLALILTEPVDWPTEIDGLDPDQRVLRAVLYAELADVQETDRIAAVAAHLRRDQ